MSIIDSFLLSSKEDLRRSTSLEQQWSALRAGIDDVSAFEMIEFALMLDSADFVRVCIGIVFDILHNSIIGPRTFPEPCSMLTYITKGSRDEEAGMEHTYTILADTHPLERNEDHGQWVHPDQ
jgi:hypothetical protein